MDIGHAVSALKEGKKVTRTKGWHGKHFLMYVRPDDELMVMNNGSMYESSDWENDEHDQPVRALSYFVGIVTANAKDTVTPWLCSQTDLLADDWEVVE